MGCWGEQRLVEDNRVAEAARVCTLAGGLIGRAAEAVLLLWCCRKGPLGITELHYCKEAET